jgi:signal transduction histidine kinase
MNGPFWHVLVVDDDEHDRMVVRRLGEGMSWQVKEASSLKGALAALLNDRPDTALDCVLMDFTLPDGDGFTALTAFAAAGVDVPVVMLTGLDDADVVVRLLNAGAADYLPKRALSRERLAQVVQRVSRARRAESDHRLAEARLHSQQRMLMAVIEQLPSGLLITDRDGRILLRNARSLELLGADLAPTTTIAELIAAVEATAATGPAGRVELARALGSSQEATEDFKIRGPLADSAVRLRRLDVVDDADNTLAHLALLDDVTDLRATEAYQRQVMAIASHDLRNPLSAIAMNAAILARAETLPDERRVKTATRITSSASRMGRMIEDLFDYTLAALGKGIPIRYREVDLAVLVEEAASEARAAHAGRQFLVQKQGDLRGTWDPDRLHQVLQNLMSNAVKYGQPNTPVSVYCAESVEAGAVDIAVENHGDPIQPELLPLVFEAYRRGPGSGRHSLGLGLYIARRIVEAHRGKIDVASGAGAGTRFTVRLPKARPESDKALLTPPQGHHRLPTPRPPE